MLWINCPGDVVELWVRAWCIRVIGNAVGALESTRDEEPGHHAEGTKKHAGTTSPFVEVENRRQSQSNVDDVLDGCSKERTGNVGTFHNVDNVVHHN